MTLPPIAVSIPWRDRAWVALDTLRALEAQEYPRDLLGIRFLCHNCEDETPELLEEWLCANGSRYRYAELIRLQDETPADLRDATGHPSGTCRDRSPRDPRHAQARIKNLLLGYLEPGESWFFCDSDILLHPSAIRLLAETRRDIVGGLARVTPLSRPALWNWFERRGHSGAPFRRADRNPKVPTRVGLVAGILLYSPQAVEVCRFRFVGVGEDEGAMRDAEAAGLQVWLEPRARGEHVMHPRDLAECSRRWRGWRALTPAR